MDSCVLVNRVGGSRKNKSNPPNNNARFNDLGIPHGYFISKETVCSKKNDEPGVCEVKVISENVFENLIKKVKKN